MFAFLLLEVGLLGCNAGTWTEVGQTLFPIMDVGVFTPEATYSTELDSAGSYLVKSPDLGKTWNVLEKSNDGALDIAASIQRSRDGSGLYCGAGGNKISVSS